MNKFNTLLAACLAAFTLAPMVASAADISIYKPWARASSKMAKSAAAFMTIHNGGDRADKLIAVESAIANRTEVHESYMEKNIMMMRHVPGIGIPADGDVTLKPGNFHVMFMGLNKPLVVGTSFPLTLVFDKAGKITIDVHVVKAGAMKAMGDMGGMGGMGGMDHSKMKHGH
ncbi:MAG: copper chaperone PCu(A)C [Alphaproteobacteria bacterium]